MNNEFLAFEHAYDDLKAKYDTLRESHMKLEQNLKEMNAENAILKDSLKEADSKCLKLSVENQQLKDRNVSLRFDFQALKAKHQSAGESIERVCNDCRKLRDENNELKSKIHYILGDGIVSETLDPVLSETPSVVINTKSIYITFDNHTNNFKEDDTE